jgi:hypothetical protein
MAESAPGQVTENQMGLETNHVKECRATNNEQEADLSGQRTYK